MLTCISCCYCVFHRKRDAALRASRTFLVAGAMFSEPPLQDRQETPKFLLQFVRRCHISMGHLAELISDEVTVPPGSNGGTTASFCGDSSLFGWGRGSSITPSYLLRYKFLIFLPLPYYFAAVRTAFLTHLDWQTSLRQGQQLLEWKSCIRKE